MRDHLPYKDFVDLAPDVDGDYVMVSHDDCDNGIDHKRRLWIKRNNDGSINAMCHNCQRSGFYKPGNRPINKNTLKELMMVSSEQNTVQLPSDFKQGVDNIPAKGLVWLYRAGLTKEEVDKYGFGWSEDIGRVIIPVYTSSNKLAFWQGRDVDIQSGALKYYTLKDKSVIHPFTILDTTDTDSPLVVTEDILSAIRCGRHMNSLCTIGVGMSTTVMSMLPAMCNQVCLFYDDDNPTVRSETLKLKRRIDNILPKETIIIHTDRDPKSYSDIELKEKLNEASKAR